MCSWSYTVQKSVAFSSIRATPCRHHEVATVCCRHVCSMSLPEEAPCVKYMLGVAEQRGTKSKLALSGERPFCRPLNVIIMRAACRSRRRRPA